MSNKNIVLDTREQAKEIESLKKELKRHEFMISRLYLGFRIVCFGLALVFITAGIVLS